MAFERVVTGMVLVSGMALGFAAPDLKGTYRYQEDYVCLPESRAVCSTHVMEMTFREGGRFEHTEVANGRIEIKAYAKYSLSGDSLILTEGESHAYGNAKCKTGEECKRIEDLKGFHRLFDPVFKTAAPDHIFILADADAKGFSIAGAKGRLLRLDKTSGKGLAGTYESKREMPCKDPNSKAGICSTYTLRLAFKKANGFEYADFMDDKALSKEVGRYRDAGDSIFLTGLTAYDYGNAKCKDSVECAKIGALRAKGELTHAAFKAKRADYAARILERNETGFSMLGGIGNVIRFTRLETRKQP